MKGHVCSEDISVPLKSDHDHGAGRRLKTGSRWQTLIELPGKTGVTSGQLPSTENCAWKRKGKDLLRGLRPIATTAREMPLVDHMYEVRWRLYWKVRWVQFPDYVEHRSILVITMHTHTHGILVVHAPVREMRGIRTPMRVINK